MTAADHYAEAERYLGWASDNFTDGDVDDADLNLRAAQVHAALANVDAMREAREIARRMVDEPTPGREQ